MDGTCGGNDILDITSLYEVEAKNITVKPILRPLSDMTKEEQGIVEEILNTFDENDPHDAMRGMANVTMLLLSKHFDLFCLIESGLAISKTK